MSLTSLRRRLLLTFLLGFLVTPFVMSVAYAADITVFAAASLKNALDDAARTYESKTGDKVVISYAASSALAKQIEGGAPADIFFSADLDWMDYLQKKNLIDSASRKNPRQGFLLGDHQRDAAFVLKYAIFERDRPAQSSRALAADRSVAQSAVLLR